MTRRRVRRSGNTWTSFRRGATRRARLVNAFDHLHRDGHALFNQMWDGLGAIKGVTRYGVGPEHPRTPTVSFSVAGVSSEAVARALVGDAVFVSNGDFYASTIVERLGFAKEGLVRAGAACYTTADEVSRLIDGVARIARRG